MAPAELRTELLRICGSKAWADRVAQTFPHVTPHAALQAMDEVGTCLLGCWCRPVDSSIDGAVDPLMHTPLTWN